jgi:hypothetical protein
MLTVHGHVQVKRELPEYAPCVECHRTFRPQSEDQAAVELCEECLEDAKYPRPQVVTVHVGPRVEHPKTDALL